MPMFKKKPVPQEFEAMQFTTETGLEKVADWCGWKLCGVLGKDATLELYRGEERLALARYGDYVYKDRMRNCFCVMPQIPFEKSFEFVS